MEQKNIVNVLVREIVIPGLQSLMDTQYFSELRAGTLSIRRLQGFALQHYITNLALNKGFALCMQGEFALASKLPVNKDILVTAGHPIGNPV